MNQASCCVAFHRKLHFNTDISVQHAYRVIAASFLALALQSTLANIQQAFPTFVWWLTQMTCIFRDPPPLPKEPFDSS
jgi:hypothetical protein